MTRLPDATFLARPWRIHELTRDFRLEDVWALPTPGGPDDLERLVTGLALGNPGHRGSWPVRALWALRWWLGERFHWDDPDAGLDRRVATLRDRMPADLRAAPAGPQSSSLPFRSLFLLEDEWAAEIANRTMHGVLHIGWVPDPEQGGFRGEMAVLVKPAGALGGAYMAAIRPFRHALIYPQMLREIERQWRRQPAQATRAAA